MHHLVYIDRKAKVLSHLRDGSKRMIIRGAMGRKLPFGKVEKSDSLYFIENTGDGLVKGEAVVHRVYNSEQLCREDSMEMVELYQDKLQLDASLSRKFAGKRFLVLISIKDYHDLEPFKIDKSQLGRMDDWTIIGNINRIKVKNQI